MSKKRIVMKSYCQTVRITSQDKSDCISIKIMNKIGLQYYLKATLQDDSTQINAICRKHLNFQILCTDCPVFAIKMLLGQAYILTPIPSTGFMYNPHMGKDSNLTCFEVFCLFSIGAFSSNTALRNCFGTLFSENTTQTRASLLG